MGRMNAKAVEGLRRHREAARTNPGHRSLMKTHAVRAQDGGMVTFKGCYSRKLAVEAFCMACLGWEQDPKECTAPLCPLFPFRRRTLKTMRGDKE